MDRGRFRTRPGGARKLYYSGGIIQRHQVGSQAKRFAAFVQRMYETKKKSLIEELQD